jgi:SAM-dependent methyltransferase
MTGGGPTHYTIYGAQAERRLYYMKEQFEGIYANNEWQYGSGTGSRPVNTRRYMRMLQRFLRDQKIRSVVDFGCGDWQFSQFIKWEGIDYLGLDIVPFVIERNEKQFSSDNVRFRVFSGNFDDVPPADLLIVKDVLQHWSNASILAFLPVLERFRFSLITNDVNPRGITENSDIADGDCRDLDLRMPPFNLTAEQVLSYTNRRALLPWPFKRLYWRKRVLLIRNGS